MGVPWDKINFQFFYYLQVNGLISATIYSIEVS